MRSIAGLGFGLMTNIAGAVVVPSAYTSTEGDANFFYNNLFDRDRTYQFLMDDSVLTGLVGKQIYGMRFRLDGGQTPWPTWPDTDFVYTDFEVRIGVGVEVPDMSLTFADNYVGNLTQVRDGGFTVAYETMPGGGTPNAFGPALGFDSSYAYNGGNLLIEFRSKAVQAPTLSAGIFDALSVTNASVNGYGTTIAARYEAAFSATFGTIGNFMVTDFMTEPVPEPATLTAIGVGLAAMAAKRRRR